MRLLFIFAFLPLGLLAQDTTRTVEKDFYDLSLEDLMNIKVSVASVKEMTPRESPGIVTLITHEEIKNAGATDLIDILKLVPGIDFGADVEGAVGIGIRGSWASEGKALLLVDGIEINEGLYSTTQYGNHFSVDNIDRIEIIRGPGSVMYGNNAEYGVINIITSSPEQINGAKASASCSFTKDATAHKNITLSAGEKNKNMQYSISAFSGNAIRSNQHYTDVFGHSYNMTKQSSLFNRNANLMIGYKNFYARAVYDNYVISNRDGYDKIITRPFDAYFNSMCITAKNKFSVNSKFSLTPEINYKSQIPWGNTAESTDDGFAEFKIIVEKRQGKLVTSYNPTKRINITAGADYFNETATQKVAGQVFNSNQKTSLEYDNYSLFSQILLVSKFANVAAGIRYNHNSIYPSSVVPRLSLTKAWEKFHLKFLYSKAYRAPNIQNIDLNPDIKPERTTIAEIEAGIQIGKSISVTANAFYNETRLPIIFYYDFSGVDAYTNLEKTGTRGFESELKWKSAKKYFGINYSFYSTLGNAEPIENYAVPFNNDVLLAFPAHKINFTGGIELFQKISFGSAISIYGPKYAIYSVDADENAIYTQIPARAYVSFILSKSDLFVKNLDAALGVRNVLDQKEEFIQPYNSLHAPLPGLSRQVTIKLAYAINFKK